MSPLYLHACLLLMYLNIVNTSLTDRRCGVYVAPIIPTLEDTGTGFTADQRPDATVKSRVVPTVNINSLNGLGHTLIFQWNVYSEEIRCSEFLSARGGGPLGTGRTSTCSLPSGCLLGCGRVLGVCFVHFPLNLFQSHLPPSGICNFALFFVVLKHAM